MGNTRRVRQLSVSSEAVVREVFYAVQGEGGRAGEASVFVRFAGCNLDCWFCDTDWQHGDRLTLDALIDLVRAAHAPAPPGWVVLTGGEPTVAPSFDELVRRLKELAYRVQVETNGTRWRDGLDWCYVTVSPKGQWEGEKAAVDPRVAAAAAEWKYVVEDGDALPQPPIVRRANDSTPRLPPRLFVQPRYDSRLAWQWAFNLVRANPAWRLSLQTHKWIGCR
jgi:organic radical activating enzyme